MSRSFKLLCLSMFSVCFALTIQAQDTPTPLTEVKPAPAVNVKPPVVEAEPAPIVESEPFVEAVPETVFVEEFFDAPVWESYTEWTFKPGNNRLLSNGQLVVPLWQDGSSLLFADLRGQVDNSVNYEGNWGLGFRTITDANVILGTYAFYDLRKTEHKNVFSQATIGVEALAVEWEARANAYIPEDKSELINSVTPTTRFSGGTIFIRSGVERAYHGVDAEFGLLLTDWNNGDWELRGFAGGFHFDNDAPGFKAISGPRFRFELRGYDLNLFGRGSRVTLGTEYQWDDVRDDQIYGMVQVRIPLGRVPRKQDRLERRMLDRIVRDVDVVHEEGVDEEIAIEVATGQQLTNLNLVDANTPDVPAAVVAAGAGSTVLVDGSKGTINTAASVVTQAGQTVRGAGIQVVGPNHGVTSVFGSRPTINNSNVAVDTVVVAAGATVRDMNVNGGRNGIATTTDGNDVLTAGSTISGNTVTGAAVDGIRTGNVSGTIANNTSTGSGDDGFVLGNVLTGGMVTGNTATNSGNRGFIFGNVDAGGTFTGNTATNSTANGFSFVNVAGNFANNTATTSGGSGFSFTDVLAGGTFTGNTATGSTVNGFIFNDVIAGGAFTGNTATTSTANGFFFNDVNGNFADNTANGGTFGFSFVDVNAGGTFTGNTSNNSTIDGFFFTDVSGSFANNTANNSVGNGFNFLDVNATGSFTGNTTTNSGNDGFQFTNVLAGGSFSTNTATGSGRNAMGVITDATANGFSFTTNNGTFANNMSIFSANNGFSGTVDATFAQDAGFFTGNVANTNGDMGFRGVNNAGTVTNNGLGGGGVNVGGGNTFP